MNEGTLGFPLSIVVALFGTIANGISLTFFVQHERHGVGNVLIISLNTVDLGVCVSSVMQFAGLIAKLESNWFSFLTQSMFAILTGSSACCTCVLCVTRMISVLHPLYPISPKAVLTSVLLSIILLTVQALGLKATAKLHPAERERVLYVGNCIFVSEILALVLISLVCSLIMICRLSSGRDTSVRQQCRTDKQTDKQTDRKCTSAPPQVCQSGQFGHCNHYATITVLIVSGLFCFFNLIYTIIAILEFIAPNSAPKTKNYVESELITVERTILITIFFLSVPLNSAINPVVYIVRKEKLRAYVRSSWEEWFGRRKRVSLVLENQLNGEASC